MCGTNGIDNYNIEYLAIEENQKITKINRPTNLKTLYCNIYVDQKEMSNMTNLEILDVSYNSKISNLNHMTELKKLFIRGTSCMIDNDRR